MDNEQLQVKALILSNENIQGDYFRIDFDVARMAGLARPGQFIHVKIPQLEHRVLRRPFSIFNTDAKAGMLSVIYKVVGEGTKQLCQLPAGTEIDIVGPLGKPYSAMPANGIIVAGGYGCAATHLLAKEAIEKPLVLIGGRSAGDILLKKEYEELGCRVRVSTNDGSLGLQGFVTQLLESEIKPDVKYWVASCGPLPMLKALAGMMQAKGIDGELSMDHAMCCGVGACFACVTKVRADNEDGWRYARVCSEGPVFKADELIFD